MAGATDKIKPVSYDGQFVVAKCTKVYDGDTAHFVWEAVLSATKCIPTGIAGSGPACCEAALGSDRSAVEIPSVGSASEGMPLCGLARFNCRMAQYNSAEIKGTSPEERDAAVAARDALAARILDKIVVLALGKYDKYGRILVNVYDADGCVNEFMMREHGCAYSGRGDKKYK